MRNESKRKLSMPIFLRPDPLADLPLAFAAPPVVREAPKRQPACRVNSQFKPVYYI